MHSAIYLGLPVACAFVLFISTLWSLHKTEKQTGENLYIAVAIALGLSAYFLIQFSLLVFVPGPGSSGPVQYASDSAAAMSTYRLRGSLIPIALIGGPILAVFDLMVLATAAKSDRPRLKGGASLACGVLLLGAFVAIASPGWVPRA